MIRPYIKYVTVKRKQIQSLIEFHLDRSTLVSVADLIVEKV